MEQKKPTPRWNGLKVRVTEGVAVCAAAAKPTYWYASLQGQQVSVLHVKCFDGEFFLYNDQDARDKLCRNGMWYDGPHKSISLVEGSFEPSPLEQQRFEQCEPEDYKEVQILPSRSVPRDSMLSLEGVHPEDPARSYIHARELTDSKIWTGPKQKEKIKITYGQARDRSGRNNAKAVSLNRPEFKKRKKR